MIGLLTSKEHNEVEYLSQRIALSRLELQLCQADFHAQVDRAMRSPWALPCCFAAGFVSSRFGVKAGKALGSVVPFYKLSTVLVQMFR
jgi:hypothetical protein